MKKKRKRKKKKRKEKKKRRGLRGEGNKVVTTSCAISRIYQKEVMMKRSQKEKPEGKSKKKAKAKIDLAIKKHFIATMN